MHRLVGVAMAWIQPLRYSWLRIFAPALILANRRFTNQPITAPPFTPSLPAPFCQYSDAAKGNFLKRKDLDSFFFITFLDLRFVDGSQRRRLGVKRAIANYYASFHQHKHMETCDSISRLCTSYDHSCLSCTHNMTK